MVALVIFYKNQEQTIVTGKLIFLNQSILNKILHCSGNDGLICILCNLEYQDRMEIIDRYKRLTKNVLLINYFYMY